MNLLTSMDSSAALYMQLRDINQPSNHGKSDGTENIPSPQSARPLEVEALSAMWILSGCYSPPVVKSQDFLYRHACHQYHLIIDVVLRSTHGPETSLYITICTRMHDLMKNMQCVVTTS